jgi:hypothetical protein
VRRDGCWLAPGIVCGTREEAATAARDAVSQELREGEGPTPFRTPRYRRQRRVTGVRAREARRDISSSPRRTRKNTTMTNEQSGPIVFRGDRIRVPRRIEASDPRMTTIQLPTPTHELAGVYSGADLSDLGDLRLVVEAKVDGCAINYGAGVPLPKGHSITLYITERAPNEYMWCDASTGQELGAPSAARDDTVASSAPLASPSPDTTS